MGRLIDRESFSLRWVLRSECHPLRGATISINRYTLSFSQSRFHTSVAVMDSGARRLVVDITDESDDGVVAYVCISAA